MSVSTAMSVSVDCYECKLYASYRMVQRRTCQASSKLTAEESLVVAFWPALMSYLVFKGLAGTHFYIPANKESFQKDVEASGILRGHTQIKTGWKRSCVQEFCNGQLAAAFEDISASIKRDFPSLQHDVTKEQKYQTTGPAQETYDVGLALSLAVHRTHVETFRIWIESDNAREDECSKKPLLKLPLILEQAQPTDFYATFIYFNDWTKKSSRHGYGEPTVAGRNFQDKWFKLLDLIHAPLSVAVIHCVPIADPVTKSVCVRTVGQNAVLTVV